MNQRNTLMTRNLESMKENQFKEIRGWGICFYWSRTHSFSFEAAPARYHCQVED